MSKGFVMTAALLASAPIPAQASMHGSSTLTPAAAAALQARVLAALGRGDRAAWQALTTSDFQAIEHGKAYDRDGFLQVLTGLQASGHTFRWSVTEPRLQADRDLAVLSYVNLGSIQVGEGPPSPVRWLETASFRREPDGWRLFLVTSERSGDVATSP